MDASNGGFEALEEDIFQGPQESGSSAESPTTNKMQSKRYTYGVPTVPPGPPEDVRYDA